jgi:hypothetical protein
MEAVSPDFEKQGILAVVFINREFSGQQEGTFLKTEIVLLLKSKLSLVSLLLVIAFVSFHLQFLYQTINF